jgi:DNA-binding response OmpR family regulator
MFDYTIKAFNLAERFRIPVIILSTSRSEQDVVKSYDLHANAYVTKPVDFEGFIEAIKQIDHFFVSVVQLPTGQQG